MAQGKIIEVGGVFPDFSSHFAPGGVCRGREVGHLRQAMGGWVEHAMGCSEILKITRPGDVETTNQNIIY